MIPNQQAILSQFGRFMRNPGQALSQAQIPGQMANDPNQIIQYLLDSGKVSQGNYNKAAQMAKELQKVSKIIP